MKLILKKNFRIERKVNPWDEWEIHKRFFTLDKAMQSFEMLKKHACNISDVNKLYFQYRIHNLIDNTYIE